MKVVDFKNQKKIKVSEALKSNLWIIKTALFGKLNSFLLL